VKRVIILTVGTAALAAILASGPASAATPTQPQVVALQKQVNVLQGQLKALTRQVTVLRKTVDANHDEARNELGRNRVGDACIALAVADLFQSTWVASAPAFGPQQELGDVSCKAIGVTRPGIQTHPTVDVFWALTGWLIG
jgi:hypothetical protein